MITIGTGMNVKSLEEWGTMLKRALHLSFFYPHAILLPIDSLPHLHSSSINIKYNHVDLLIYAKPNQKNSGATHIVAGAVQATKLNVPSDVAHQIRVPPFGNRNSHTWAPWSCSIAKTALATSRRKAPKYRQRHLPTASENAKYLLNGFFFVCFALFCFLKLKVKSAEPITISGVVFLDRISTVTPMLKEYASVEASYALLGND